jgi:hypothetical protein
MAGLRPRLLLNLLDKRTLATFVRPPDSESLRHIGVRPAEELYYRTHLSIHEGVS